MADVSVIIPCYNGRPYIVSTLDSVLNQTDPPLEVLVIDDGSTDGSATVVDQYCRNRPSCPVTLIRQANAGESKARNVGIERSGCRYLAFLDADDSWLADKTTLQMRTLADHPDAVAVHSRVFNFHQEIDDLGRPETEQTKDNPGVEDLMTYHWVTPSSVMVRREVLMEQKIRFNESVRHSEDMLFLADLRLAGPFRLTDQPLVAKRVHMNQQSKNPWHRIYSLENRVRWCRERRTKLGGDVAERLEAALGQKMIATLEDLYWRRQTRGFTPMRDRVTALFPGLVSQNRVINRFIFPRWVYGLKDLMTAKNN